MKHLVLLAVLSFASFSFAQDKVQVHFLDDELDGSSLSDSTYRKVKGSGGALDKSLELPSPSEMKSIFKKAGIWEQVSAWDTMDQDIFFSTASEMSVQEILKRYPQFSQSEISKLKKLLKERK